MDSQAFVSKLTAEFMDYMEKETPGDMLTSSQIARALFDSITQSLLAKDTSPYDEICAQNAVIEVINEKDNRIFRRYLELSFRENDNGLKLSGENLQGEHSDIVFLSNSAVIKLNELKGAGPDSPQCKEE